MKQALGLAVSGTEVRMAHLVLHKGQLQIEALERARLVSSLEFQPTEAKIADYAESEPQDAFGYKENGADRENAQNTYKQNSENLEILYKLLEKFARKKIKMGFNVPVSMVNYHREGSLYGSTQTAVERGNGERESGPNWAQQLVKSPNGASMNISFERQPPTMTLLRDVKGFLRNNLYLGLMDTSEMSLANLARSRMPESNRLTAIIYIEDEFTRLIFMRGKELIHVSSIIHESATSPDILEVICRKLIYEQDEANLPEISSIVIAGRGNRLNAKEFFAERFYGISVDYLYTNRLGRFPANERECETFSEFAVPIALAWKMLQPKNPSFTSINLLPQEMRDQQEVLKLSIHGYVLLALTGLAAFLLTWQILKIRSDIGNTRIKNSQLEMQIKNNQSTVDKVLALDNQSKRLKKNLTLADSLSRGHDEFLVFLQKLNSSVRRSGNLWVDQIQKQKDGFSISGTSMNRETIPILAEKLDGANLRRVTRGEVAKRKLFQFELEQKAGAGLAQFSDHDVRIIDVNKLSRSGNLILTKEDDRRSRDTARLQTPSTASTRGQPLRQQNAPDSAFDEVDAPQASGVASESEQRSAVQPNKRSTTFSEASDFSPTKAGRDAKPLAGRSKSQPRAASVAAIGENARSEGDKSSRLSEPSNGKARNIAPTENTQANGTNPAIDTNRQQENSHDGLVSAGKAPPATDTNRAPGVNGKSPAIAGERLATTERSGGIILVEQPNVAPARDSNTTAAGVDDKREPQPVVTKPGVVKSDRYRAYTIEAAARLTKENAERVAEVFRRRGVDAMVQNVDEAGSAAARYRVLVGLFATQDAAHKKASQLSGLLARGYRIIGL
jgi:hypothetical protein